MEEHQIGWIAAIIIGGIAGWLAEQFMKSQMGLVMNIVLDIIGAAVASLAVRPARYLARRLARLSHCGLHRSLHPNRDRPSVQRRSSAANMNARRTQALRQRDGGLARPVGVRFRPCSLRPLKVGDVYFGHFFYRRLHIV